MTDWVTRSARGGWSWCSVAMASDARPLACACRYAPRIIVEMSVADVSNISMPRPCLPPVETATSMKTME